MRILSAVPILGPGMFDKIKSNKLILHPSGSESYGIIQAAPKFDLLEGGIYLRAGEHFGQGRGFGVRHIWAAHSADLAKFGCHEIEGVGTFISTVVMAGSRVYCEFNNMRGNHRVTILRNPLGSLILEPRNERRGFGYYVVTWYPNKMPKGTLVSRVG